MADVWADPYFEQGDKVRLLVALAIADSANSESGLAWPALETLSRKARTSIRGAQESLRELERDGKVEISLAAGPHGTNLYRILPRTVCTPDQKQQRTPPYAAHPARSAPRKRAAEKAPEKAALDCTQSVRNGNEPPKSITPPPSPPAVRGRGIFEGAASDFLPTSEQSKRIATIANRRLTTPWSEKEIAAYKKIGHVEPDDLKALERYYAAERAKGDGDNGGRHRRDLLTLLNNFTGEIDRARSFRPFKGVSPVIRIDEEKWRRFLTSHSRDYEPYDRAMPYLREEFTKFLALEP